MFRFDIEGFHRWPEAKNYLRHPHRHLFRIEGWQEVQDNNREVEFIELRHQVEWYLRNAYKSISQVAVDFGDKSCESIAEDILNAFRLSKVSVFEDNENGAVLEV